MLQSYIPIAEVKFIIKNLTKKTVVLGVFEFEFFQIFKEDILWMLHKVVFLLILGDQPYNDTKADRALQRKEKYISMFFRDIDKNLEQTISKLPLQKK